jgi:microcystin degradation protein MlrC
MVDPVAVQAAYSAGPGAEQEIGLGSTGVGYNARIVVSARVLQATDQPFIPRGDALRGLAVNPGLRALLQIRDVRLLVVQHTAFLHDPEAYRSMGQEPEWAEVIVQKSHQLFKPGYRDIMRSLEYIDTPGPSSRDLAGLGFRKVERPIFPLDDVGSYRKSEEYVL